MFRDRMYRFMIGRNGVDQLGRFCLFVSLGLVILTWFTHWGILYLAAMALLGYSYFRMMSKNVSHRYLENQRFLQIADRITPVFRNAWVKLKSMAPSNPYRVYVCPTCKQKVRVPKGKGRIEISCPRCHGTFIKRT